MSTCRQPYAPVAPRPVGQGRRPFNSRGSAPILSLLGMPRPSDPVWVSQIPTPQRAAPRRPSRPRWRAGSRRYLIRAAFDGLHVGSQPGADFRRGRQLVACPPDMPCSPSSCSTALASSSCTGPSSSGDKLPTATVSPHRRAHEYTPGMAQNPREPSRVSRMMSAWPAWRAVSSIIWNRTYRTLHSMMSLRAHGLSRSIEAATARDCSICSR